MASGGAHPVMRAFLIPHRACGVRITVLGVALACALLVDCGARPPEVPAEHTTLRIAAALPTRIATFGLSQFVEMLYADQLVAIDWNGRPQGRLIDSWGALDNGPGLRLHVRGGVTFHDGKPLTAPLVRDVLRRTLARNRNIASIEATGEDIAIRLHQPDSFLLADLNFVSVLAPWNNDIGTGAFKFVTRSRTPTLEAFKGYYRGAPTIDRVEFQTYPSQRAAWAAMMRGQADLLHEVSRDAVEFVEEESEVKAYSSTRGFYLAFVFNLHHPELRKPEVRQAISEAVDRAALIKDAMRGRGLPADGPIWPYHWAYSAPAHTHSFNPEAARLRLASAGLAEVRHDSASTMPSRLRLRCLYYAEDSRFDRIAMVLQRQLSQIGVDVEMEPAKAEEFQDRVATGKFDAFLNEMTSGRSLSWLRRFWHSPEPGSPTLFDSGYVAADAAIDAIRRAQSDDETRNAVAELQRVLYDDPPAVFLVWPQITRAVDTHFRVPDSEVTDILGTIWQWRRQPVVEVRR